MLYQKRVAFSAGGKKKGFSGSAGDGLAVVGRKKTASYVQCSNIKKKKVRAGIEPTNISFAD